MADYKEGLRLVPPHMHEGISAYIETGQRTGGFLYALLSNDLMGAFGKADLINTSSMESWVRFLYNYAPAGSYGSPKKVAAWQEKGGLKGGAF